MEGGGVKGSKPPAQRGVKIGFFVADYVNAVDGVIDDAFAAMVASGTAGDEAALVRRLRADGDMVFEALIEDGDAVVVAHVAYSQLTLEPTGLRAVALAPLSVVPAHQGRGLGQALMRFSHERLRDVGVDLVVVMGHPDYYPKVGFSAALAASCVQTPYDGPHLLALALNPAVAMPTARLRRRATYPAAFTGAKQ